MKLKDFHEVAAQKILFDQITSLIRDLKDVEYYAIKLTIHMRRSISSEKVIEDKEFRKTLVIFLTEFATVVRKRLTELGVEISEDR